MLFWQLRLVEAKVPASQAAGFTGMGEAALDQLTALLA